MLGIGGRRLKAALKRYLAVGAMRLAPARDRAGDRQGRRNDTTVGDLAQPLVGKPSEIGRPRGLSAPVQVTNSLGLGIVDEPERIAADAGHMGVDHSQRSTCGN